MILLTAGLTWSVISDTPGSPVRLGEILEWGGPDRIMALGALTLALTPFGGVVALILLWWRERDYRFVATGLAVVGILGTSRTLRTVPAPAPAAVNSASRPTTVGWSRFADTPVNRIYHPCGTP